MSTNTLRIIPTDPTWVPASERQEAAFAMLERLFPDAETIQATITNHPEFIDQGGNFELVRCPRCGTECPMDWWQATMGVAYQRHFRDLNVTTPCCAAATTLNDLDYEMPTGFARFVLEADNPYRGTPTEAETAQLADAVGHPIRFIWRRL